jgi:hypothetical protein
MTRMVPGLLSEQGWDTPIDRPMVQIINRIQQYLETLSIIDEVPRKSLALLQVILPAIAIGATGYVIFIPLVAPAYLPRMLIVIPIIPVSLGLLFLARRGYTTLTGGLLVVSLWLVVTFATATQYGLLSPDTAVT